MQAGAQDYRMQYAVTLFEEADLAAAIEETTTALPDTSFRNRAWFMVFSAMLCTMCCSTAVMLINVGVFLTPLAETFSWNRGDIVLSLSIAAISMAAANPVAGRLIDVFGVRPVLIASMVLYGLAVAATPFLVNLWGLPGLYVAYALIAGLGAGSNVIAYVRLLSGWFTGPMNGSRGLALGISSAGLPLGTVFTAPVGVLLIDQFGWEGGYYGLALLPLCLGLPIAMFLIRPAPHEHATSKNGADAKAAPLPGLTVNQALKTRAFWLLVTIALLMSSCLQGIAIHTAPLLSDFGTSAQLLAIILAADGVLGIVGRVGAGYLFDKFFAPHISLLIFGTAAAAAFAFVGMPTFTVAVIATMFITLGSGAESDFIGYLIGRYFGLRNYGQIFGLVYAMFMVGIALGPFLFGVAFDKWGDYSIPYIMAGVGLSGICVLLFFLPNFSKEAELISEGMP